MSTIDISKVRLKWKGKWRARQQYFKNDIVQWMGKSFKCIKDTPVEFVIKTSSKVSTSNYTFDPPQLVRRSYRPENPKYWSLFVRGTDRIKLWNWLKQYFPGEMVRVKGEVFLCTRTTRYKNTYVTESDYWTKIYQSPKTAKYRHESIMFCNRAPLGWKYNMGENQWGGGDMSYNTTVINTDGTSMCIGGTDSTSKNGRGADGLGGAAQMGKHQYTNFTFVDWLTSTDQSSWQTQDNTGKLTTPDGKCPKVIQIATGSDTTLWLMNNGEVYSAGFNGQGQLGISNTTNYAYTNRVTATDTTDWNGNTIPNTFNQTKIVKIGITNQMQTSSTSSCFALGEDGSVWVWGYNNVGQLGLGNPGVNNSADASGFYTSNQTRPRRICQDLFDGKFIVDMWCNGCGSGRFWALDEEGKLWAWGYNQYGELGVGHRDGTYYVYHPMPVTVDFKQYGGVKKFMTVCNDAGVTTTYVLDHEGWLWACGYTTSGSVPGANPSGGTSTLQWGAFRRLDFYMNGDIEEFWVGGDESQWCIIRQKNSDLVWQTNGRYSNGSDGAGINQGSYWYTSGGQANAFNVIDGPRGCRFAAGHSLSRVDGSQQWADPIIFDDDGVMWAGGRNYYGFSSLGFDGANDTEWSDGGPHSPDQDLNDNEYNFNKKRKLFVPSGLSIVDIHAFGYGSANMFCWRDEAGKILFAGYDGSTAQAFQYNRWPVPASSTAHRYFMHSGPND